MGDRLSVVRGEIRGSPRSAPGGACAGRGRRSASAWTPSTRSPSRPAIFGALLYSTASSALGSWLTPDHAAEWGPAVALVALAGVARWGTWQGPVVFAAPDVPFLLGAPLGAGPWRCAR